MVSSILTYNEGSCISNCQAHFNPVLGDLLHWLRHSPPLPAHKIKVFDQGIDITLSTLPD